MKYYVKNRQGVKSAEFEDLGMAKAVCDQDTTGGSAVYELTGRRGRPKKVYTTPAPLETTADTNNAAVSA